MVDRKHEHSLNDWLGEWLGDKSGNGWEVTAEGLGAVRGSQARLDMRVVREADRMPVVAEFEVGSPAVSDAADRLGIKLKGEPRRPITEVLAVGYSEDCREDNRRQFHERLNRNEPFMTIQVVSGSKPKDYRVWPSKPLVANAEDLMAYIEYLQVPQAAIEELSAKLADEINELGTYLLDNIRMSSGISTATLKSLRELTGVQHALNGGGADGIRSNGCNQDRQAVATATAIWLVVIDLQNDLARHSIELKNQGLRDTRQVKAESWSGRLTADDLQRDWHIIKDVNYLPVVEVGIATLNACLSLDDVLCDVLGRLDDLCRATNASQAKHVYNFVGEFWQSVVHDREERAAHYTKPQVAELLATLASQRFDGMSSNQLAELKLMDAASGTGTLIAAGERAIRRKYRFAGGDYVHLHRERMENHLFAMDVNGVAGTLTAKRLTDLQLDQDYRSSNIAVITHPSGSLLLMDPNVSGVSEVLGYEGITRKLGPGGDFGVFHIGVGSMDWALMNPPYSRPRKDRPQLTKLASKVTNAAKRGGYKMRNGQAGLASAFGDLSNIRLKPGGVFAHVLPLTAAKSVSWSSWRAQLRRDFKDIVVVTSAESMSADTDLGEILVVATKQRGTRDRVNSPEILCVNLNKAIGTLAQGYSAGCEIARIAGDARYGDFSLGRWNKIKPKDGAPWVGVGTRNAEIVVISDGLINGEAWDPVSLQTIEFHVPMMSLDAIAETGPTHHTIGHPADARQPIGAYKWTPIEDLADEPTHLALWSAEHHIQTTILAKPTHAGRVRDESDAIKVNAKRSRWFIKRDHSWGSQVTTMAHSAELLHGGRAWTALIDGDDAAMRAVTMFHNSIFGAMVRNAFASTQQRARANFGVGAIGGLPTPAFHEDSKAAARAREIAAKHFNDLSTLELQPFPVCYSDFNRHKIDDVVAEMLGLDVGDSETQTMMDRYRVLFAAEPNVNGGRRSYTNALKRYREQAV